MDTADRFRRSSGYHDFGHATEQWQQATAQ